METRSPNIGARVGRGRRVTPDRTWDAASADYLAGLSGPEVCAKHDLRLGTFKKRARTHGWRRKDQVPPDLPAEPLDEGHALEAEVEGDLNRLDYVQLAHVANCRMMRAVLRGGAIEALRWSRVEALMEARQGEVDRWVEEMEAASAAANAPEPDPDPAPAIDRIDRRDSSHLIFADDGLDPPIAFRWVGPKTSQPPDWMARPDPVRTGAKPAGAGP